MASLATTPASAPFLRRRLSVFEQLMLSVYWFAESMHWTVILVVTLQSQMLFIVGDEFKGRAVGLILAIGALISMVAAPFFGAYSDRIHTRWGRRRPFMVVGVLMNLIGLVALAYIPRQGDLSTLLPYVLAFMWVEFWNNVATAPYSALIPDMVMPEQRGEASGWMGLMRMLGNFLGAAASLFLGVFAGLMAVFGVGGSQAGIIGLYWFIIVVNLLAMLGTVIFIKEPKVEPPTTPMDWSSIIGVMTVFGFASLGAIALNGLGFLHIDVDPVGAVLLTVGSLPLGVIVVFGGAALRGQFGRLRDATRAYFAKNGDFVWVLLTRLLITLGVYTVQEFLQYYLGDVIKDFRLFGTVVTDRPEIAVSFFLLTLIIGAIISAYFAGALSDRYGRKLMVYLSGALQAAVVLLLIPIHDFTAVVLLGIVFGLGYGAYQSVDWALATDVLPSEDYAKDMGIWHVADVLPQMIGTPFAGFFLDTFNKIGRTPAVNMPNIGYTVIFGLAIVYMFFGTVFVRQIKKVR
ncbi:MAG: MFS transporter [Anaerolineae bacterium]